MRHDTPIPEIHSNLLPTAPCQSCHSESIIRRCFSDGSLIIRDWYLQVGLVNILNNNYISTKSGISHFSHYWFIFCFLTPSSDYLDQWRDWSLTGFSETYFCLVPIELNYLFRKMHLQIAPGKWGVCWWVIDNKLIFTDGDFVNILNGSYIC